MSPEDETAALEGYLFGEAERLLVLAMGHLPDTPSGIDLEEAINAWRRSMRQLHERWRQE